MSQLYNRAKLLNFPAFYVLLSYIKICYTQKDKLTAHDLLWADRRTELGAQEHHQVDKPRRQSWLHFPGAPLRKEGPAHSPLWTGGSWGMIPSTLSLVHTSVQRGIIVTAHYCPPRATRWDPVPRVSAMACVPKSLCELPPCSALHHSPHRLFTYKHPALFKVQLSEAHRQDRRLGSRTSELLPSSPAAPSKPFHCFVPLSPCKAGRYLLYFHTNHWIYGSKLLHKSWTSAKLCFCSITFTTLTFGEFQKTKHSPETVYSQVITQHSQRFWDHWNHHLLAHYRNVICKGFIY